MILRRAHFLQRLQIFLMPLINIFKDVDNKITSLIDPSSPIRYSSMNLEDQISKLQIIRNNLTPVAARHTKPIGISSSSPKPDEKISI